MLKIIELILLEGTFMKRIIIISILSTLLLTKAWSIGVENSMEVIGVVSEQVTSQVEGQSDSVNNGSKSSEVRLRTTLSPDGEDDVISFPINIRFYGKNGLPVVKEISASMMMRSFHEKINNGTGEYEAGWLFTGDAHLIGSNGNELLRTTNPIEFGAYAKGKMKINNHEMSVSAKAKGLFGLISKATVNTIEISDDNDVIKDFIDKTGASGCIGSGQSYAGQRAYDIEFVYIYKGTNEQWFVRFYGGNETDNFSICNNSSARLAVEENNSGIEIGALNLFGGKISLSANNYSVQQRVALPAVNNPNDGSYDRYWGEQKSQGVQTQITTGLNFLKNF